VRVPDGPVPREVGSRVRTPEAPRRGPLLRPPLVHWAVGITFALLVLHAARSGYDHDEIEHLHAAWLVSQGLKPFHDFMEQHHPTLFYLLAPLASLFPGSPRALVFSARLLDLSLLALLLLVFNALVRPLLREGRAAWPPLMLLGCFFFVRNSMEVRPDPWMNLLCFLGLWQWVAYLRPGSPAHRALLAGLCFGAAIAFLPKAVFFLGLVGLGTVLSLRTRAQWAHAVRGGVALFGAALVPLGALALPLWRSGTLSEFFFWNYTFNRFHYLESRLSGVSPLETLLVSFGEDVLLWMAGLWGVWFAGRSLFRREAEPAVAISATVVLGILGAMFRTRWPFSHNLLLLQPALALLAVLMVDRMGPARLRALAGVALLLMLGKVWVLCFVYTEGRGAEAVQQKLLREAPPSTPLAVSPPYNPIFRPDAFFFWYIPQAFVTSYLEWCRTHGVVPKKVEDDRRAWRERPPRFVYVPKDEPDWAPFEFAAHRPAYLETDVPGLFELRAAGAGQPSP
jgi:4-amino-4-deoxy-L-arabinose transferase-like glycosyltransferase